MRVLLKGLRGTAFIFRWSGERRMNASLPRDMTIMREIAEA